MIVLMKKTGLYANKVDVFIFLCKYVFINY